MIEYKLIRSARTSIKIQIDERGLTVRAPHLVPKSRIDAFVNSKSAWIEKNLARFAPTPGEDKLTEEEVKELKAQAKAYFNARLPYYAGMLGVNYGTVSFRLQTSRWGSCSTKGNLNFNILLMLAPEYVRDATIAHELCHRRNMNHSKAFYADLARIYPDYKKAQKWLREEGHHLMQRNPNIQ